MPVDWVTPLLTCCGLPLVVIGLIAFGVAFARWTSPAGQERIRRRSEELGTRARERALSDRRRGFDVENPQERKPPPGT